MEHDPLNLQHPLLDAIDLEILMHRNVHFGGNFSVMIEYYQQEGVGVMPDFSLERIEDLASAEKQMGTDLADSMLPESAKIEVEKAKQVYLDLRTIYEQEDPPKLPKLIADVILTEEEEPKKEIEALVQCGKEALPALIDLIQADTFYEPLYPGYGRAPIFAAEALEKMHDPQAIPPLFEALGKQNFFTDEALLKALASFGDQAREFLAKRLMHKPLSKDNEIAAMALNYFPDSEEVAKLFLTMLEDPEVFKNQTLVTYSLCGCSALAIEDKSRLEDIYNSFKDKQLKEECALILKSIN